MPERFRIRDVCTDPWEMADADNIDEIHTRYSFRVLVHLGPKTLEGIVYEFSPPSRLRYNHHRIYFCGELDPQHKRGKTGSELQARVLAAIRRALRRGVFKDYLYHKESALWQSPRK